MLTSVSRCTVKMSELQMSLRDVDQQVHELHPVCLDTAQVEGRGTVFCSSLSVLCLFGPPQMCREVFLLCARVGHLIEI